MQTTNYKYRSCLLPQDEPLLGSFPINHRILSRKVIRGTGANHYRINILQSGEPTPYPGNLDYRIEREISLDRKNHPSSQWQILDQGQIAGVGMNVFSVAASLLRKACEEPGSVTLIKVDGATVPVEFRYFCQALQQLSCLLDWRKKLMNAIRAYSPADLSQLSTDWHDYAYSRAQSIAKCLSLVGFGPLEEAIIMQTFSVERGIHLKGNYYIRYLKAANPERYAILHCLQSAYYQPEEAVCAPDDAVKQILAAIPKAILAQLVRPNDSLWWVPQDLFSVDEAGLQWELSHGRSLPYELLAMHPALAIQYGFNSP